ncbi:hypothetical protein D5086_020581 [Populus alba]|uniref:Uncharacterized protein n=1 Tax=Populus alba TaxID=43335 RepID=A0ACC4BL23_POPAL
MNIGNMEKMLKFANNDDIVIIKADGGGDAVCFMFESPSWCSLAIYSPLIIGPLPFAISSSPEHSIH